MRIALLFAGLFSGIVALPGLVACTNPSSTCTPGTSRSCSCLPGVYGQQACGSEGFWGNCGCSNQRVLNKDPGTGNPALGPPSTTPPPTPPPTGTPLPDQPPPRPNPPPKVTCPASKLTLALASIKTPRPQGILAFHPDGKSLVSNPYAPHAGNGSDAYIWSLPGGALRATLKGHASISGVAYHPNGKELYTAGFKGGAGLKVWNASTGALLKTLPSFDGYVTRIAISGDGKYLGAVGAGAWILRLSDATQIPLLKSGKTMRGVAFDDTESTVYVTGDDSAVSRWTAPFSAAPKSFPYKGLYSYNLVRRPGKEQVITIHSRDRRLSVWDTSTGQALKDLKLTAEPRDIAASPDGTAVASVSDDGKVIVWDIDAGTIIRVLHTFRGKAHAVAFSPQGLLAAAGDDSTIRVFGCP